MALSDDHRDRIEAWAGEVKPKVEKQFEDWSSRFGEPELAALQWLKRRQAQMVVSPTQVGSGSDRVSHGQNLKAIEDLIGDLVSYISSNLDDLDLTEAGADLLASAAAGPSDETIVVDTVVSHPRAG